MILLFIKNYGRYRILWVYLDAYESREFVIYYFNYLFLSFINVVAESNYYSRPAEACAMREDEWSRGL